MREHLLIHYLRRRFWFCLSAGKEDAKVVRISWSVPHNDPPSPHTFLSPFCPHRGWCLLATERGRGTAFPLFFGGGRGTCKERMAIMVIHLLTSFTDIFKTLTCTQTHVKHSRIAFNSPLQNPLISEDSRMILEGWQTWLLPLMIGIRQSLSLITQAFLGRRHSKAPCSPLSFFYPSFSFSLLKFWYFWDQIFPNILALGPMF